MLDNLFNRLKNEKVSNQDLESLKSNLGTIKTQINNFKDLEIKFNSLLSKVNLSEALESDRSKMMEIIDTNIKIKNNITKINELTNKQIKIEYNVFSHEKFLREENKHIRLIEIDLISNSKNDEEIHIVKSSIGIKELNAIKSELSTRSKMLQEELNKYKKLLNIDTDFDEENKLEKISTIAQLTTNSTISSVLNHNQNSGFVPESLRIKNYTDPINVEYMELDKPLLQNVELTKSEIEISETLIPINESKNVAPNDDELMTKTEQSSNQLIFRNNVILQNVIYQDPYNQYQIGFDEDSNLVAKSLDKDNTNAVAITYNDETDQAQVTIENDKSFVINYFSEKVQVYGIDSNQPAMIPIQESIQNENNPITSTLIEDQLIDQTTDLIDKQEVTYGESVPSNNLDIESVQYILTDINPESIPQSESDPEILPQVEVDSEELIPKINIAKPVLKPKSQQQSQAPKPIINKAKQKPERVNQNLTTPDTLYNFLNNLYDTPIPQIDIKETADRIMGKSKLEKLKAKYPSDK
jgi:hypothetical protein